MAAESLLVLTVALGVTRDADIRTWLATVYTAASREMQGSCEARHP